jgi:hypothetical protein
MQRGFLKQKWDMKSEPPIHAFTQLRELGHHTLALKFQVFAVNCKYLQTIYMRPGDKI